MRPYSICLYAYARSVKCQSTDLGGLVMNRICFLNQSQKHFNYEKIVMKSYGAQTQL